MNIINIIITHLRKYCMLVVSLKTDTPQQTKLIESDNKQCNPCFSVNLKYSNIKLTNSYSEGFYDKKPNIDDYHSYIHYAMDKLSFELRKEEHEKLLRKKYQYKK